MTLATLVIVCVISWAVGAFFMWTLCAGAAQADDKDGSR